MPKLSCIFISDLHLDPEQPQILTAFDRFIQETGRKAEKLFILGDFFEVWLGDDHHTEFNEQVIEILARLDIPGYIMHGNRDFLIGAEFCARTGFDLLPDPTTVSLYDRPVLLMHGDSLCTRDTAYMAVRKMLRDPAVQQDLLSKSLAERAAIAVGARKESKQHTRETADDIMDVTSDEVINAMNEHDVSLLIHGHTHRPAVHDVDLQSGNGQRVVLGDWADKGWYVELSQQSVSLESFDIGTPL
jgi:UDP-2,3-diacylglucosamine hydrolase